MKHFVSYGMLGRYEVMYNETTEELYIDGTSNDGMGYLIIDKTTLEHILKGINWK